MATITGVGVGSTDQFAAIAVPAGSTLPEGTSVPTWTSSDVTTATVASPNPDATGLTTTVEGLKTGSITLTVACTTPTGTIIQGSAVVPVIAGVTQSFTISQVTQG